MLDKTVDGIEYWAINSDHQALSRSKAKGAKTLSIGATVTRGLGAGGDPAKGQLAAEENMAELAEIVEGADLIFITAGMVITRLVSTAPFLCELLMCVCATRILGESEKGRWHRIRSGTSSCSHGPVGGSANNWDCYQTFCL